MIVLPSPPSRQYPGFLHSREDLTVEEFIPEFSIEALRVPMCNELCLFPKWWFLLPWCASRLRPILYPKFRQEWAIRCRMGANDHGFKDGCKLGDSKLSQN
jgi:hypothetical protein